MTDLDRRLAAHYGAQVLDGDALARMRARIRDESPSAAEPDDGRWRTAMRWWQRGALAAAVLLTIGLVVGYGGRHLGQENDLRRVADEITLNHIKRLEPEFESRDFRDLAAEMGKLDFAPSEPVRVAGLGYDVLGARYCSIGGAVAAQIRLIDDEGRPVTLYQLRGEAVPGLAGERVWEIDGVEVTLWREAGLVMGLARAAP